MVLVTRADKRKVYLHLLREGVIVLKKDYSYDKHVETGVPNLFVWMLLRTLKSKDLVELVFNWQYFYYYIKTEGVEYLRKKVGIEDDKIVPITFKATKKQVLVAEDDEKDGNGPRRPDNRRGGPRFGGRGGFRRGDGEGRRPDTEGGEGGAPQEGGDAPRRGGFRPRGSGYGGGNFRRRPEGGAPAEAAPASQ